MKFIEMRFIFLLFAPFLCFSQTIWNGPLMTFTKQNMDDPNLASSQDRITDLVWLTRGNKNILYNAKTETSAVPYSSPEGTRWAEGSINNLVGLEFTDFKNAAPIKNNGDPHVLGMIGKNYVLHLIEENIYVDLKIVSWQDGFGGGFSYERTTDPSFNVKAYQSTDVFVHPNPTSGLVQTDPDIISQMSLFDLTGKQLLQTTSSSMDLSPYNKGMYLIRLFRKDDSRWVTRKVVKQ